MAPTSHSSVLHAAVQHASLQLTFQQKGKGWNWPTLSPQGKPSLHKEDMITWGWYRYTAAISAVPPHFWWVSSCSLSIHIWGGGKQPLGLARGLLFPPGIAHSFLTQLTNCSLEAALNCHNSSFLTGLLCLEPFPFPCPPTLLLWALSLFSSPVHTTLNFSNLFPSRLPLHIHIVTSPPFFFFLMETVSWPEPSVTITSIFWSPVGKMGSLLARTRAQVYHYASQCWSHFVSICFSSGPKDLLTHYTKWGGFPAWKCIFKNLTLLNDSFC